MNEKFTLNFSSAYNIVNEIELPAPPKYSKISRTICEQTVGNVLVVGTKFMVVSSYIYAIDDHEKQESVLVPMLNIVTHEGLYKSIYAGAFSGSASLIDGTRISPDTLNIQHRNLAYKKLIGCKLNDVCTKLHAAYGKEQLYEVVGFRHVEAEESRSGFAKNIYSIAICE